MTKRNNSYDRRVGRTRQSIRGALIEIILEKHYHAISVQDIIDRANVGRSTFYQHFRDKEDLFRGDWQRIVAYFVEQITIEGINSGKVFPISEFFNHLKDFHHLYRALVKSGKIDQLFSFGQRYLAERIETRLAIILQAQNRTMIPLPILANYLATEVFSNLKWWLDNRMPTPAEQMDEIFHQLVVPGLINGLKNSASQKSGI